MIPVKQTKRGGPDAPPEERGDCFDACLASVLEVPLADAHVEHGDDWWDAALAVAHRHGHSLVLVYADNDASKATPDQVGEWFGDVYWLASVPSRSLGHYDDGRPVGHVVVMRGPELVHDPGIGPNPYEPGPLPEGTLLLDAMLLLPLGDDASRTLRREGWRPRLAHVEHLLAKAEEVLEATAYPAAAEEGQEIVRGALAEVRSMIDGS